MAKKENSQKAYGKVSFGKKGSGKLRKKKNRHDRRETNYRGQGR